VKINGKGWVGIAGAALAFTFGLGINYNNIDKHVKNSHADAIPELRRAIEDNAENDERIQRQLCRIMERLEIQSADCP